MENNLIIEIRDVTKEPLRKIFSAMEILAKAAGRDFDVEVNESEPTPYESLRQLADEISKQVEDDLKLLYREIAKKWFSKEVEKASSDPIRIEGKLYINPATGKYLTEKEWGDIASELKKLFGQICGKSKEKMVKYALALGKILRGMDSKEATEIILDDLEIKGVIDAFSKDEQWKETLLWANVHTGELIQGMVTSSRKKVMDSILEGYANNLGPKAIQSKLFEEFGFMNRDWRRIAETETSINFNNGYLKAELGAKAKEEKYILMQGVSGAGACPWCENHVKDKVV